MQMNQVLNLHISWTLRRLKLFKFLSKLLSHEKRSFQFSRAVSACREIYSNALPIKINFVYSKIKLNDFWLMAFVFFLHQRTSRDRACFVEILEKNLVNEI